MEQKQANEVIRKSIHVCSLIIPFSYRYIFNYNRLLMFLILLGALILDFAIEMARLEQPTFRKLFHKLFGPLLRRHERRDFTGATFVILSAMLCTAFFKPEIAFLSMSYLAVGDTLAATVGMTKGKRKYLRQNKTLEGSLACFVGILIFSLIFGNRINPLIYVVGCLMATLAEIWNIPVDDNIKIPISAGIAMSLFNIFV